MNIDNLKKILENQPKYRINQVKSAIFKDLIGDWNEAKYLPKSLKDKLNKNCPLEIKAKKFKSKGGETIKALIVLDDGLKIETVLMKHKDNRNTVCVSSEVGCPMGCKFCATGKMGFKRNLTKDEIIKQVLFFSRYLKNNFNPSQKITNIVFMGMGEPFLNYDNVLGAIRILNDKNGFNLGARNISISTCGIIDGIKKLAEEGLQVNLAISLHAPNDSLRSELMPVNKKYRLKDVFDAVDYYIEKTSRRVMFEYLLIEGVNDPEANAKELADLMKKPLYFVNLIPYNPTGIFRPSTSKSISLFKKILEKNNVVVTQRYSFGREISAACGQLAGNNKGKLPGANGKS